MIILIILQKRDLAAGFGLVSGTYTMIGVIYYLTFPMAKQCIEDVSIANFFLGTQKFGIFMIHLL